ncbi:hypothetical protein [Thermus oshimai]|nr:hypothetical protein [Thermus oshimai]
MGRNLAPRLTEDLVRRARALGARVVWSEDLNPQDYGGLRVKNPFP